MYMYFRAKYLASFPDFPGLFSVAIEKAGKRENEAAYSQIPTPLRFVCSCTSLICT